MEVVVNKIIPFSSVDGPGNRTAIFLQGCNINCKYCHNPETRGVCQKCGVCVDKCPQNALEKRITAAGEIEIVFKKELCVGCDTCIHVCPHDSSPRTRVMDEKMVFGEVKKQIPFIRGITVSGGECMLQPDFMTELFKLAKKANLSTMIDSNGTIDFSEKPELLAVTDSVMLDIKAFDCNDHHRITGANNDIVIKNAVFLAETGKLFEVRIVVVPDLYDAEQSVNDIANLLAPYNAQNTIRIKLISYRPMGVREEYKNLKVPDAKYMQKLSQILYNQGFSDVLVV